MEIKEIIKRNKPEELKALFSFTRKDSDEKIALKFNLWVRFFFTRFFESKDAPFHKDTDLANIQIFKGKKKVFVDIKFRGSAKRQPLDAKILTPKGFTTMGKLKLGDLVIGSDGKSVKIEYLSPIIKRPIYSVYTEDGRKTECDLEHLWTVRRMSNTKNKSVTLDLQKIIDSGLYYKRLDKRNNKEYKEYKYALETVAPVELNEKELPLNPYTVGVLLGDGSMDKEWGSARLHFHKDDDKHYRKYLKDYRISETKYDKRNKNVGRFGINGIAKKIKELGMNVNCYNKFVPEIYLYGSIQQRKSILEGLMDTDGTVNNGTPSFSTVSEALADNVVELVRSLGGRANKTKNNWNDKISYRISILFTDYKPFQIKRKLDKCKLASHTFSRIVKVEKKSEKFGRCIKITNEDGLYVTDNYLLTHNTTRKKLFWAFCIANDTERHRKYRKILTDDTKNSKQIVTDIYNLLVSPRVKALYPEIFAKTEAKREETMSSFTTATGMKIVAGTVGTSQRGDIQDEARPDEIWLDDFETRKTLRSAVTTQAIWDNMEEAKTGLSKNGAITYTCNYISEMGNVHKLVIKARNDLDNSVLVIIPLEEKGEPTWEDRYTKEDIKHLKKDADDYEGEYLCKPSATKDIFFSRDKIDEQRVKDFEDKAGLRVFHKFDPSHRIASGHDISGGLGLNSSTSVFIDFTPNKARVVATFVSNNITPDIFGDEIRRQADMFGTCLVAPENNNHGHTTIARLKQIYPVDKIHKQEQDETKVLKRYPTQYGWNTNAKTKPEMLYDLQKAINDDLLELSDERLIAELRSYTRNDLMDREIDPRLSTRHFDLLIACAIAWAMRDYAVSSDVKDNINWEKYENKENLFDDIGI